MWGRGLTATLALSCVAVYAQTQAEPAPERISTSAEVAAATHPGTLWFLRVLSYPQRKVTGGMERGLISFERNRVRERISDFRKKLRERGIEPRFGGSGEGTGIGGGLSFKIQTGEAHSFNILALLTVKRYQELGLNWAWDSPIGWLWAESSYQWRPEENFYGLGHTSSRGARTNFALRQTWVGVRYEIIPVQRIRVGVLQRIAWLSALPGRSPFYPSPDFYFTGLAGYGTQTRLRSTGVYLDVNGLRKDYELGGAAHFGASYQHDLGGRAISYFGYEAQLEGQLPIFADSSALVGQANIELNRSRRGSGPIPFYLLPHIGGSSTLRGFALDRFYGTNLMLLSLEYRYLVHPNIQAIPFFDEGQIFDRTDDLSWLNWHRNFGLGFRFRTATGTFLRIECGRSSEGFLLHITFGDRERPPLRGPIRYGAYKR